jgi:hypothetical protein
MSEPLLSVEVPANELQIALVALQLSVERGIDSSMFTLNPNVGALQIAAYLAIERAWLRALYPHRVRFPLGANLPKFPPGTPCRLDSPPCFQEGTKQLLAQWLRSRSPTTRLAQAPKESAL